MSLAKILELHELGDPIIRQVAKEVRDFGDPSLQRFIDNMIFTCEQKNGVGLAAPQVGQSIQVMIIASRPSERYPHAPTMEPLALINPTIIECSADQKLDWEGCLSIPGIRAKVSRHKIVIVRYWDRLGFVHRTVFEDFVARIFMHEYDHLQGRVFLDDVDMSTVVTEREYQKIVAAMPKR